MEIPEQVNKFDTRNINLREDFQLLNIIDLIFTGSLGRLWRLQMCKGKLCQIFFVLNDKSILRWLNVLLLQRLETRHCQLRIINMNDLRDWWLR